MSTVGAAGVERAERRGLTAPREGGRGAAPDPPAPRLLDPSALAREAGRSDSDVATVHTKIGPTQSQNSRETVKINRQSLWSMPVSTHATPHASPAAQISQNAGTPNRRSAPDLVWSASISSGPDGGASILSCNPEQDARRDR